MPESPIDSPEIQTLSENILISPIACVALGLLKGLAPSGSTWAQVAAASGDEETADDLRRELWGRDLVREQDDGTIHATDALVANGAIPSLP